MIWTKLVIFGCLLHGALSAEQSACEGETMDLMCAAGEALVIDSVFWGRVSETQCPDEGISDYDCAPQDDSILETVRRVCADRNTCSVAASWRTLGDPCPGTYKHANITYRCLACEDAVATEDCMQEEMEGRCAPGADSAFDDCYKTCSRCEQLNDTTCVNAYGDDADCDYWALWGECANNPDWMRRNCQQSCKACQGSEEHTARACEGGVIHLECDSPYHLSVQGARYGRFDDSYCPHETLENATMDCMRMDAVPVLQNVCGGRAQCDVSVMNDVIMRGAGDPCEGVYKQMEVDYKCMMCENQWQNCSALQNQCHESEVRDNCFQFCTGCHAKTCGNDYSSDEDCDYWAMDGECAANPGFMTYQCSESCDKCSCSNIADDSNCDYWAGIGECEANPGWMPYNCRKSCGQCDNGCDNYHSDDNQCNNWAYQGECQANPFWMQYQCKQACYACGEQTGPFEQGACEGDAPRLHCDNTDQRIRITELHYGRRNNNTCAHASVLEDTEVCGAQASIYEPVKAVCNGREHCTIYPSNGLFGDPCPGVTKQLEVSYMCQECKNSAGDEECQERAEAGQCDANPEAMLDDCFQECTGCALRECSNDYGITEDCSRTMWGTHDCGDDLNCDWWAMRGECEANPDWMLVNCAKSCRDYSCIE